MMTEEEQKKFWERVTALRARVGSGLQVEEAIVQFHDAGFPIIQSIRALVEIFGMSLTDAKMVTASHPLWRRVARAAEPLHDELEKLAREHAEGQKD